jgi:peroxiredoxin
MKRSYMKKIFLPLVLLASLSIFPIQVGQKAPDFQISDLKNQTVELNKFSKNVVILDFWATWCVPCKKSLKFYQKLHEEYYKKGLRIICISVDEDLEDLKNFLEDYNFTFIIAQDPKEKLKEKFKVKKLPTTYIIDKSTTIRKVMKGFHREHKSLIREELEKLL